jgi:hypothetical protein
VGSREDSDSKEITEEAEEEKAIAKGREGGSDMIDNGCKKKATKEDAGGKFIKAKVEVK